MPTYNPNQTVDFYRNSVQNENNVTIAFVIPKSKNLDGQDIPEAIQEYIITYTDGWLPSIMRQNQYGLNANTKYFFVNENELST